MSGIAPELDQVSDGPRISPTLATLGRHSTSLLWVLLFLSAILFAYRGFYRGVRPHLTNDFFSVYSISKAWMAGEAPYSTQVIVRTFEDASGYTLGRNTLAQAASYSALPGMVPLATPFTLLRWRAANSLFVIFSTAILGTMLWRFARRSGASRNSVLAFLICALALGPIHTGLSGSNVTPLLVGLMGISYLLNRDGRWLAAGILLGVVGCCKPHIAGAMVLVLIVDGEWKTLVAALSSGIASLGVFVARLSVAGVPWWSEFLARTRQFGAVGDANDFSPANPARYELLNLQVILGSITSSRVVANVVAIAVGVALVAAWWIAVKRSGRSDLLAFATINVVLLLPAYHRFDDASVLVFLFAAAWLERRDLSVLWVAGVSALLFALPIPAMLVYLVESGRIPHGLLTARSFQLTFLSSQIWFLFAASLLLVWGSKMTGEAAPEEFPKATRGCRSSASPRLS
ncbi:MAG: glycosyltransferase family 87 protein [Terriglobia bacterium]|nr:glycosyltransferase family 87 protein [Terriglobia bacterium]